MYKLTLWSCRLALGHFKTAIAPRMRLPANLMGTTWQQAFQEIFDLSHMAVNCILVQTGICLLSNNFAGIVHDIRQGPYLPSPVYLSETLVSFLMILATTWLSLPSLQVALPATEVRRQEKRPMVTVRLQFSEDLRQFQIPLVKTLPLLQPMHLQKSQ